MSGMSDFTVDATHNTPVRVNITYRLPAVCGHCGTPADEAHSWWIVPDPDRADWAFVRCGMVPDMTTLFIALAPVLAFGAFLWWLIVDDG